MKTLILPTLLLITSMAIAQDSLNIKLLFQWDDSTITTANPEKRYSEIWGIAQDGREYAVLGSAHGTHIFDITIPESTTEIVYIPGASDSVIHRDYHDYRGYLYMVADEGEASLQIVDLSFLPDTAFLVYDSDSLIQRTHNIFIDTAFGVLYETGGKVLSLENPEMPELLGQVEGLYGHDLYVRNDTAYWNNWGIYVYYYPEGDRTNPQILGSLTEYPDKGYNHSGWLSEDGKIYAFADEDQGLGIKICDMSNLADIEVVTVIPPAVDSTSMPHNLMIKEGFLYVSYYHDGLYIYNIKNPASPYVVGFYDTYPDGIPFGIDGFWRGLWGVYSFLPSGRVIGSDRKYGLFIFDVDQAVGLYEFAMESQGSLYPNPVNHLLNLDVEQSLSNAEACIYDASGRIVRQITGLHGPRCSVDVSDLSSGLYLLKITDNLLQTKYKFVVE